MALNVTVQDWYNMTIGKSYNTDGYYGAQCWDYFDYFCQKMDITASRYCAITGYAGDLWKLRNYKGYQYSQWFTYVTDANKLLDGDWVFYDGHVTMYYQGKGVGQNQTLDNKTWMPYVAAVPFEKAGFIGAFRYKSWKVETPKQDTQTGTITTPGVATKRDYKNIAGNYTVTPSVGLYLRIGPKQAYKALILLKKNTVCHCYAGYYDVDEKGRKWLYVQAKQDSRNYVGFVCMDYLKRC